MTMKYRYFALAFLILGFCLAVSFSNGTKDTPPTDEQAESSVSVDEKGENTAVASEESEKKLERGEFSYFHDIPEGGPVTFHEVWGYVMQNREYEFKDDMKVTDLVYFSADVNSYGEFDSIPKASKFASFKGRKHLSVTCQSRSLAHFVLDPQYGITKKIIATLTEAAKGYDGINIDFELIPARDIQNFRNFVRDMRASLGQEKWLTIAVPARLKTISDDAFNYAKLEPYVDRIFIMAYDEHWSTSKPGAIASTDWCRRIANYALEVLPQKKVIMGLPFYGRTWQAESYGQAWYFSGVNRIMGENNVREVQRDNGVPYFTFDKTIKVTGYFEDAYSTVEKCKQYKAAGCDRIGFWRIGQEDPSFWNWLNIK
ncbi:MAG: glycoside hydrolase [Treponema sp.]|nr:glycoside hydrolase [Treponema sp.]